MEGGIWKRHLRKANLFIIKLKCPLPPAAPRKEFMQSARWKRWKAGIASGQQMVPGREAPGLAQVPLFQPSPSPAVHLRSLVSFLAAESHCMKRPKVSGPAPGQPVWPRSQAKLLGWGQVYDFLEKWVYSFPIWKNFDYFGFNCKLPQYVF